MYHEETDSHREIFGLNKMLVEDGVRNLTNRMVVQLKMIYLVDLVSTLVDSTNLNNDAYIYSLQKFEIDYKFNCNRITRRNINSLDKVIKAKIIRNKRKCFTKNWLPYRILINHMLIKKLVSVGKYNCYIGTKVDSRRAEAIIEKCGLSKYFNKIIFDKKESFT